MKTITMRLIKENKTLVEYAEVDAQGQKLTKPALTPIYIRKGTFEPLPNSLTITLTPES